MQEIQIKKHYRGQVHFETVPAKFVDGGLAIHGAGKSGWTITHVKSGLALSTFRTYKSARKAHGELIALPIDWTSEADQLENLHKGTVHEIYRICAGQ